MTTATSTYHPGLGSVEGILSANTAKMDVEYLADRDLIEAMTGSAVGGFSSSRTTLAIRSSVGDQIEKLVNLIPSFAKDIYGFSHRAPENYLEAKNTVDALKSVAIVSSAPKVLIFLSENADLCDLALKLATVTNNRTDVDRVIVEIEQDPESDEHSLFVTAVVSTEDFTTWDAIDEHILGTILEPSAAINRARVVFSIAHAESV